MLDGDSSCVVCGKGVENLAHLFRDCKVIKELGLFLDFHGVFNVHGKSAWLAWLLVCMDQLAKTELETLLVSMWALWSHRNTFLFEGNGLDCFNIIRRVQQVIREYKTVHHHAAKGQQRPHVKWEGPPRGRLKLNFDGSFDSNNYCGGIGVIVRDELGVGIAAVAQTFKYASSALCMEAEACKIGLQLGIDQGWHDIDIEGDSIQLVVALLSETEDISEVGQVIEDCRNLLRGIQNVTIRHTFREANGVAHRLAHLARLQGLENVWLDGTPAIIQDVLFEDQCNMPTISRVEGSMPQPLLCTNLPISNNIRSRPAT